MVQSIKAKKPLASLVNKAEVFCPKTKKTKLWLKSLKIAFPLQ